MGEIPGPWNRRQGACGTGARSSRSRHPGCPGQRWPQTPLGSAGPRRRAQGASPGRALRDEHLRQPGRGAPTVPSRAGVRTSPQADGVYVAWDLPQPRLRCPLALENLGTDRSVAAREGVLTGQGCGAPPFAATWATEPQRAFHVLSSQETTAPTQARAPGHGVQPRGPWAQATASELSGS